MSVSCCWTLLKWEKSFFRPSVHAKTALSKSPLCAVTQTGDISPFWIFIRPSKTALSKPGVSNIWSAGRIRPPNGVFFGPRDDFAKYENELQFSDERNCSSKYVLWMQQCHCCYANKLLIPRLSKKAQAHSEATQPFDWVHYISYLPPSLS